VIDVGACGGAEIFKNGAKIASAGLPRDYGTI
jgi:hypothetical protein